MRALPAPNVLAAWNSVRVTVRNRSEDPVDEASVKPQACGSLGVNAFELHDVAFATPYDGDGVAVNLIEPHSCVDVSPPRTRLFPLGAPAHVLHVVVANDEHDLMVFAHSSWCEITTEVNGIKVHWISFSPDGSPETLGTQVRCLTYGIGRSLTRRSELSL